MRLAVIGSRWFLDYDFLEKILNEEFSIIKTVISGGAKGVDTLAKQYALNKKIQYIEYLSNWKLYGKAAGIIRNSYIINECDEVIAFWDYSSVGTKNAIGLAQKLNKNVKIISIQKNT